MIDKIFIKALFKGKDGSLGYRYNMWYDLIVYSNTNTISRTDGTGYCEYGSIYAFYSNWSMIEENKQQSVLQDWVIGLPLRMQGTLTTAVRGCDFEAKTWTSTGVSYSPGRRLTAFIRYCFMVPADVREVGSVEGAFMMPEPPENFKPSEFGHLPQHWYSHAMHALEVISYCHPDTQLATKAYYLYRAMVHNMHLNVETLEEMTRRLTEDRIATGTVVS